MTARPTVIRPAVVTQADREAERLERLRRWSTVDSRHRIDRLFGNRPLVSDRTLDRWSDDAA